MFFLRSIRGGEGEKWIGRVLAGCAGPLTGCSCDTARERPPGWRAGGGSVSEVAAQSPHQNEHRSSAARTIALPAGQWKAAPSSGTFAKVPLTRTLGGGASSGAE